MAHSHLRRKSSTIVHARRWKPCPSHPRSKRRHEATWMVVWFRYVLLEAKMDGCIARRKKRRSRPTWNHKCKRCRSKWRMKRTSTSMLADEKGKGTNPSKVPTSSTQWEEERNDASGSCLLECRRERAASQPSVEERRTRKRKRTLPSLLLLLVVVGSLRSLHAWSTTCRKKQRKERKEKEPAASRSCDAR